ncbi:hypothetical protein BJ322DRAFT_1004181 [Thelephora terrestris]|uniref:Alcohol acetyltransferase n=1 Tax=Thelephora terrestris TaxID=56493 RepID=A0A9P6HJG4_9AGAM|nr:hypothetical protein BJ322DRAFT_1004181 [Thelephora terrestris]
MAENLAKAIAGFEAISLSSRTDEVRYERKMGNSELSYYLPSRANGVNDMYLHLGFKAPTHLMERERVRVVWAILRQRHPLLAATVEMHDYDDVRFVDRPAASTEEAINSADANLEYRNQPQDQLIHSYLNGPRTLSNQRISYLVLSAVPTPPDSPDNEPVGEFDLLICAAHFLGDGMALHQFAHDFFTLLGSQKSVQDLEEILTKERIERWGPQAAASGALPCSIEESLPQLTGRFRRAVAAVDFKSTQSKLIGGHVFPRVSGKERRTIVPTVSFDENRTKTMLKVCKAHGVSISAALFALCNIVWARMRPNGGELPIMMYSALNLRPYMYKSPASYWFLAVGYFNVVLPAFLPRTSSDVQTFWLRARQSKDQSARAAKNAMAVYRTHEMSKKRGAQARAWGKEDDQKADGTWVPTPPAPTENEPAAAPLPPKAPSNALIGLSLLGNLDGIYKHQDFESVKMHTLTTGSRQRNGGMLLFGYTFVGKLWLSLGYDVEGFEKETVNEFWSGLQDAVEEFLG